MAKKRKRLGVFSIAAANLSGQGLRTAVMELLCFILAASIFASSILLASLERGVEQTVNRLGADVIVVPKQFAAEYSASLFSGEHCSFYFDGSWLDRVAQIVLDALGALAHDNITVIVHSDI